MKSAFSFLASTLTVGFVALLPILLCYLLLGQLVDLVLVLSTPILDILPDLSFAGLTDRQLVAVVLLVALLLVVGLIAQTRIGQRTGTWLERTFLGRLPLYELLRSLANRLSGAEDVVRFRPVTVTVWPGVRELGFIVEDSADGEYTVFIPSAPAATTGAVRVVAAEHVRVLDVPPTQMLKCITSWGDGVAALLKGAPQEKTDRHMRS